MGKDKKSQITFVMIIVIFIIIIAILIYAPRFFKIKIKDILAFDKATIQKYIDECMKITAEDGLKLLGKQGGYINLGEHLETPNLKTSYLLLNNKSKVPPIEEIENELSLYMDNNLNTCLRGFEDFKKQGWDVEKGELDSKTKINQNDVAFEVNYPIKITNKGDIIKVDKSLVYINVRFMHIYNILNKIVDFNIKNPKYIDRSDLDKYGIKIKVYPYQNSLIYVIDDPKSLVANQPYRLILALHFS